MPTLKQLVKKNFILVVSLPVNLPEWAQAATAAGADALKVHIDVQHHASGTQFGPWEAERSNLLEILKVEIPVGLVMGEKVLDPAKLQEVLACGFDYWDIFAHHMPLYFLNTTCGRMAAVDGSYTSGQLAALGCLNPDAVEVSPFPPCEYGKPLNGKDLLTYAWFARHIPASMLISTQRAIKPEEVSLLQAVGARGVVIGAVVTGKTTQGIIDATKAFRQAIDRL